MHEAANRTIRGLRASVATIALAAAISVTTTGTAHAQTVAPGNLVSVCSGVSLPRSAVTDIISPVIGGIVTPLQSTVNPILGVVGGVLPLVPPLSIDAAGLLANAAAGQPIRLQVLNANGTIVGAGDPCNAQATSLSLTNPAGLSIGGNAITGLGATGQEAVAGSIDAIALGNLARTDPAATGAIALGAGANVGAGGIGSIAFGQGASATGANSVALGAGSVASRGTPEVSIGAPGAERQLTNVAAGTAPTDAANTGQVAAVAANVAALAGNAVQYDTAARDRVTLGGTAGTVLANVAPGTVAAGSTEAVNGSQLAATNARVTANEGAITNLDVRVTATEGAIAGVQGQTTVNTANITEIRQGLADGTVGLVRQDPATRGITVAAQTDGTNVDIAGTQGDRTLTGVATSGAGDAAVNGSQLAAAIATFGAGATLNADGSITIPAYAVQRQNYSTVGGAIGGLDTGLTAVRNQVDAINRTADGAYVAINSTGPVASATGAESVAIGGGSTATANNSVALGGGSTATRGGSNGYAAPGLQAPQVSVGEVSVGTVGGERQITNVAAGSAANDAVNVAQLQGVAAASVQYDRTASGAPDRSSVTLGTPSAGPTGLHNVAPGTTGLDAVNMNQLAAIDFNLRDSIRDVRTEAQRGTAVALAANGMRFDDRAGRTSVGGSVSYYKGETGVALGLGHTSNDQRLRYNAAVSFSPNGGSNVGAVAGATFSFGD